MKRKPLYVMVSISTIFGSTFSKRICIYANQSGRCEVVKKEDEKKYKNGEEYRTEVYSSWLPLGGNKAYKSA